MAESAPVNSSQAMGYYPKLNPTTGNATFAGEPATFDSDIARISGDINIQDLALSAVGVVVQDSVRGGSFRVEPKLVSSYVASSAMYQLWASKMMMPYLMSVDVSMRYEVGKIIYNSLLLPVFARVFGGKITLTNSVLTSAGTEFFVKGMDTVINKP